VGGPVSRAQGDGAELDADPSHNGVFEGDPEEGQAAIGEGDSELAQRVTSAVEVLERGMVSVYVRVDRAEASYPGRRGSAGNKEGHVDDVAVNRGEQPLGAEGGESIHIRGIDVPEPRQRS